MMVDGEPVIFEILDTSNFNRVSVLYMHSLFVYIVN